MKYKKLDLHGTRHGDVDRLVENFILMNQNETPLEIVCGNSQPMIGLVDSVLKRINCENYEMVQYGVLMVRKV
ncbi:MAG: hypothetical protein P8L74_01705 [Gammaproteobacteria bacterium]|jgi:hypothetical protein|nr:hypothetical protein [Gammaproteobacteria bacterium]